MTDLTTATVESDDGTSIAYEVSGHGPTVVLVDGAMCFRGGGPMRPLAERLSDRLRVVCYDRRGRGESGDTEPYAPEREVEDLAALIRAVGGPVGLYAVSSGVALALEAAAALGRRIGALALYEPPYLPRPDAEAEAYSRELERVLAAGDRAGAIAAFLRRVGVPDEGIQGMRHSPGWPALESLAHTLAYDARLLGDSTIPSDTVGRVTQPSLVLSGEASMPLLREASVALNQALPHARHRTLPGQTHDADPDAVAGQLAEFFA